MVYFVMFIAMVQTFVYDIKIIDRLKINKRVIEQYLEPYKMVKNRLQEWVDFFRKKSRIYLDQSDGFTDVNETIVNNIYYDDESYFREERYQMERMIFVIN